VSRVDVVAVAESSKLGDVPLTPAQRATLRRHVERVQTTLRPYSKQRADVRQLFHKHKPSSEQVTLKSEDEKRKQHDDSETHFVTDVNTFCPIELPESLILNGVIVLILLWLPVIDRHQVTEDLLVVRSMLIV